jgi:hypothetical protein
LSLVAGHLSLAAGFWSLVASYWSAQRFRLKAGFRANGHLWGGLPGPPRCSVGKTDIAATRTLAIIKNVSIINPKTKSEEIAYL